MRLAKEANAIVDLQVGDIIQTADSFPYIKVLSVPDTPWVVWQGTAHGGVRVIGPHSCLVRGIWPRDPEWYKKAGIKPYPEKQLQSKEREVYIVQPSGWKKIYGKWDPTTGKIEREKLGIKDNDLTQVPPVVVK